MKLLFLLSFSFPILISVAVLIPSCFPPLTDSRMWKCCYMVIPLSETDTQLIRLCLEETNTFWTNLLHSCTGEGNGNPLQCSYLENPRDGGAWWASVYGVAQSRTQLKQLSSSSSSFTWSSFYQKGKAEKFLWRKW